MVLLCDNSGTDVCGGYVTSTGGDGGGDSSQGLPEPALREHSTMAGYVTMSAATLSQCKPHF